MQPNRLALIRGAAGGRLSGEFPCVDINRKPMRTLKRCFDQGLAYTPPPAAARLPGLNDIRLLPVPQRDPVVGM